MIFLKWIVNSMRLNAAARFLSVQYFTMVLVRVLLYYVPE